jgi:hypothetical protein
VLIAERIWQTGRRRRGLKRTDGAAHPDYAVEEHLSPSGMSKVVVYPHGDEVFRVELFRRMANDPAEASWLRVGGPSYVDRSALAGVVDEALRAASGGASEIR